MKCKYCGSEIPDGSEVCTECGQKIMRERSIIDPFPELDEYRRLRNRVMLVDEHSKPLNIYCYVMLGILAIMFIMGFILKLEFLPIFSGFFILVVLLMLWGNNRKSKRVRIAIGRPLVVILPILTIMIIVASIITYKTRDTYNDLLLNSDAATENVSEDEKSVIYEAFFLDNAEVNDIFTKVRGEKAPYELLTNDYHITTVFMPEKDMHELYGTEVEIHIFAYKDGEVMDDDGNMTANEGLFCTVTSDNEEMQSFIDNTEKNWHITGSYKEGAKYTEYIDPSDGLKEDFTIKGTFGAYMSDGSII